MSEAGHPINIQSEYIVLYRLFVSTCIDLVPSDRYHRLSVVTIRLIRVRVLSYCLNNYQTNPVRHLYF